MLSIIIDVKGSMINYFCFFCYFCLKVCLFCQPVSGHSLNYKYLKNSSPLLLIAQITDSNIKSEDSMDSIDDRNFIPGLWRGFHQVEELSVYYAYQFRNDNRFLARHRIYEDNKTIEDINWQGEWQLIDDSLELKGINLKDKTQLFTLEFKLRDDFKLVYQKGSLSEAYHIMILNKVGRLVNHL